MRAIKTYWQFLLLYFFLGSIILLLNASGHVHNDLVLRGLILLPLLLLVPRVQTIIKRANPIILFVLLLFVVIHASPFVLSMQLHHQGTAAAQHPCCIPQVAALVSGIVLGFAGLYLFKKKEDQPLSIFPLAQVSLTARAPPYSM